ncbi:hypothetical protein KI387_024564, partial [Taxus chinensis]
MFHTFVEYPQAPTGARQVSVSSYVRLGGHTWNSSTVPSLHRSPAITDPRNVCGDVGHGGNSGNCSLVPIVPRSTASPDYRQSQAQKAHREQCQGFTSSPKSHNNRTTKQSAKSMDEGTNRMFLCSMSSLKLYLGWLLGRLKRSMKTQEIACYMGLELGKIKIKRFADGEIYVQLQESVRGCDVFLVQPTCPPANENLMELLVMVDACRRASAQNITVVIPYFGYARADRKTQGRESIAAKLVANLITEAGANRVLACDLHSGQSMGYFDIPVDHVYGQPVILDYLASKIISSRDLVVVSPDVGGVARARAFAKKLSDAPLAIVDKRRYGHNVSE